ncbi:MAG: GlsB/YeaQ/YmgE family stress response membrane protein [Gemmatimonadales bacterium]
MAAEARDQRLDRGAQGQVLRAAGLEAPAHHLTQARRSHARGPFSRRHVGTLGAFIGGWLFTQLGVRVGTGLIAEIFKAFVGAGLLLLALRGLRRL